ncbi:MAG: hypothetical protein K9H26_02325 [Prolixibacteraceae bacterium]|nr:hypothetical protein [Prolixibacteraceae bacterium]
MLLKEKIVFTILLLILFVGCKEDFSVFPGKNQKILFQCEYINHAWGYQHSGWLIDSFGNVHCYNLPENWFFCDSLGKISSEDMEMNLMNTDSICLKIDKNELNHKVELIGKATRGTISEPAHEMCDAGIIAFSAFIFYNEADVYQKLILRQTGDFRIENDSKAATELCHWMDSICLEIEKAIIGPVIFNKNHSY